MNTFYKNTEQISELVDEKEAYEFKLPKYGKSTTDPTYYEPMATAVANMRNSAVGSGKSLYDFSGDKIPKIENTHIMIGRKPGMTIEEISQIKTINDQLIKNDIQEKKISDKEKVEKLNDIVEASKVVEQARSEEVAGE